MSEDLAREYSDHMSEGTTYVGLGERMSHRMAPTCDWTDMGSGEHFVQFFESDGSIVNDVSEYMIHGLRTGGTCIVVAASDHLEGIERQIGNYFPGIEAARISGSYISLDAHDLLSKICTDGAPDEAKFFAVVGGLVNDASARGGAVRIYGEMVGILCSRGRYDAAVKLEGFWNELRKSHQFSLFCGYLMSTLVRSGAVDMSAICNGHTRVIPTESYSGITSTNERLKHIATLQQRTRQLEAEIVELERRIAARGAVRETITA